MTKRQRFWNFIVLAIIGGFFGLQEFYMERWVLGVLAVLFCWTCIPAVVAFVEAIVWLFRGEDEFYCQLNKRYETRRF